jgi:ATP-dependent RNA helicase DHX8/PRP22
VNVYRAAAECLEKSKNANDKEKTMEKALNRWCWENFINYRSLRHARDVHRLVIIYFFVFVLMEGLNCWARLR